MYHYVRDLKKSRYPEIKALEKDHFIEQIHYILKHYNVIRMEDLFEVTRSQKHLPEKSVLLTFDDGYIDHFETVFPILKKHGVQGSFFVPGKVIKEHEVLDVNKIHFILASVSNKKDLIKEIFHLLDKNREEYDLQPNESYYSKLAVKSRFDNAEIIFIKRLLQKELEEKLRNEMVDELVSKYVSDDEENFSKKLYMSTTQLKDMTREGMYVGSHGWDHYWLDTLAEDEQENEIKMSLKFLKTINRTNTAEKMTDWAMCYPYGACNGSLFKLLKKHGCKVALTTEVDIADLDSHNHLALPRLDTNDLPKNKNARPTANIWTTKVLK